MLERIISEGVLRISSPDIACAIAIVLAMTDWAASLRADDVSPHASSIAPVALAAD
jgi:hypothetical protein